MQCPGCGFENESDNKFCNMCGMGLPAEGASFEEPVERDPLEIDLSMELDFGTQEDSVGSGSTGDSSLLLDSNLEIDSLANDLDFADDSSGSLKVDEAAMDFGADFNFENDTSQGLTEINLNDADVGLEMVADTLDSMDFGSNETAIDLEDSSNINTSIDLGPDCEFTIDENPGLCEFVPQNKSEEIQSHESELGVTQISEGLEDYSQNTTELELDSELDSDLDGLIVSTAGNEAAGGDDLMSFGEEDSSSDFDLEAVDLDSELETFGADDFNVDSLDAGLSVDSTELAIDTDSFDFGDLDANNAVAVDADLDTLEMDDFETTDASGFEQDFDYSDDEEDATQEQGGGIADAVLEEFHDEDLMVDTGLEEILAEETSQMEAELPGEFVAAESESDELDDLARLIGGLEAGIQMENEGADTFAEAASEASVPVVEAHRPVVAPVAEAQAEVDMDLSTIVSLAEHHEPAAPMESLAELNARGYGETEILTVAPELTPLQQFEELKLVIRNSDDPDERYSMVVEMSELRLPESKTELIALLTDELKDIREVAATTLGELEAKEAVKPLVNCLSSEHGQLKFIAARSLGQIRHTDAVIPLIKLLEEENEDLRYVTLEALGKIGSATALKAVSAFLKSRNNDLRYISCEAIGNIADPSSVAVVLPMLKDVDFEVKLKAIEALGKMASTQACDHLLVVLSEENERTRTATIQALGQIKNANAVEPLIDIYQISNPQLKEKIIWALGEIGDSRAIEPLLKLSNAFNTKQTVLALEAFSKIKSSKASRYILSILEKADPSLTLKAIDALGEIAEKSTAGNLIEFLDSSEPTEKIAAATALGKIANPIALEPLIGRLIDSERDVRLSAIEALGKIKGLSAIEPLINSLAEQDSQVIEKAEWAICEIGEVAVETLNKAIQDDTKNNVLSSLVKVLGKIGSIKAIFPLLKVLDSSKNQEINTQIADSLLAIDEYLTTSNPISVILKESYAWAQFSIAQALANLNDERAFGLLIKIARDVLTEKDIKKLAGIPDRKILECSGEILHLIRLNVAHLFAKVGNDKAIPIIMKYFIEGDQHQREWCVEALGGIKTNGALDALIDVLKKPEYNLPIEVLSKQLILNGNKKLVEKLIMGASHPSEQVRFAITTVLGDTQDPRAIRTLSNLVTDQAEKVRTAAIEAIGKIGTVAAVQPAIEALQDSIETVRAKAAQVLGELKDTAAVEFLDKSSKDKSELVRKLSIKSLALMADARVPDIIMSSLTDKTELVRKTAVEALGERRDRVALKHLAASLEDPSDKVRAATAEALAKIGDPVSIMPLLTRLDDPSPLVPIACSEAIVSFGENSYDVLIEALKHSEDRIRRHSSDLLIRIGEGNLILKLLRLSQDRNSYLRENIAKILGKIGNEAVVEPLMQMLTDRSSVVRKTAAESLGSLSDIRCLVALKAATKDQSKEVRLAANQALQEIFKAHKL